MFSVMQVYRLILDIFNHEFACFCDALISDLFHTFETLKVQCVNVSDDLQFNSIQLKCILSCTAHKGYGTPGRPSLLLAGGTARVFSLGSSVLRASPALFVFGHYYQESGY